MQTLWSIFRWLVYNVAFYFFHKFFLLLWFDLLTKFLTANESQEITKANMLIYEKFGLEMWPQLCSQGFSLIWPGDLVFDQKIALIQRDPRNHQENLFWAILMKFCIQICPVECSICCSMTCPVDLVFDPRWPIFLKKK